MILWIGIAVAALIAVAVGYKLRRLRERARRRFARQERREAERVAWDAREFQVPQDAAARPEDQI